MALASAQIALTAASTYSQYTAAKQQGRFQQQVADQNADIADQNAKLEELKGKDAIIRGDKAASELKVKTRGLIGRQRAALAAQGIDIGSGSALDIQADTAGMGAMDALVVKNNAWREAWGFKVQADNYRFQGASLRTEGRMARAAGRNEARTSILTGGLQAVQSGISGYDRYQRNKGTKYKIV